MEVACAGKVLVTGGYLVLYPEYSGLVLATTCKITARLHTAEGTPGINITSQHFNKTWAISWTGATAEQEADNPFVSAAATVALSISALCRFYIDGCPPEALNIDITADPEFYGDGKSGLGSSAAVISCVVGVLFQHWNLPSRELLHFACQLANTKAQNKVGSGFDIAACVFGSHVFRRLACPELATFASVWTTQNLPALTKEELDKVLEAYPWSRADTCSLPDSYHLVLAPMGQGSNTRILAAQVVKWHNANLSVCISHTAKPLFDCLHNLNQELVIALRAQEDERLRSLCTEIWSLQRQLSGLSEVEVLPEAVLEQLKTVVETVPEVVVAGVPGAGGYDAAYFIVRAGSWQHARSAVESVLGAGRCLSCQAR